MNCRSIKAQCKTHRFPVPEIKNPVKRLDFPPHGIPHHKTALHIMLSRRSSMPYEFEKPQFLKLLALQVRGRNPAQNLLFPNGLQPVHRSLSGNSERLDKSAIKYMACPFLKVTEHSHSILRHRICRCHGKICLKFRRRITSGKFLLQKLPVKDSVHNGYF